MEPKTCEFCKKVYVFPCDGKRYGCANAVWVRAGGSVKKFEKEMKTIDDKLVKNSKRKRVRLK